MPGQPALAWLLTLDEEIDTIPGTKPTIDEWRCFA